MEERLIASWIEDRGRPEGKKKPTPLRGWAKHKSKPEEEEGVLTRCLDRVPVATAIMQY